MLRKPAKAAEVQKEDAPATADARAKPETAHPMQTGSLADHPSFLAPQFGFRAKKERAQPSVHIQRSPRRSPG